MLYLLGTIIRAQDTTNTDDVEAEIVTEMTTNTVYTCSVCTSTSTSNSTASSIAIVTVSVPVTITEATRIQVSVTETVTSCKRAKRTIVATKTICARCTASVTYQSIQPEMASMMKEVMATLKPCVRCDNRPNCTEPIKALSPGDVPPCRICCSGSPITTTTSP